MASPVALVCRVVTAAGGGRYSPRWFDHAGLSPPSALSGRPDSRRSSSDHGTGGLVQPMAVSVDEQVFGPCQRVKTHDMQCVVGGKTALRAVAAAMALAASAACSSTPADTASPSATVRTEPPTTTTTNPYAVPEVIDVAYVNRVLAGLDAAVGDVTRMVVRTRTIPREAYDRLRAIYATDDSLQLAIDILQRDIRRNLMGYSSNPGNQVSTVVHIITGKASCVFAQIRRDYSAIGPGASTTSDRNWVALRRLDPSRDIDGYNQAGWSIAYEGFPPDRSEPSDQCVG